MTSPDASEPFPGGLCICGHDLTRHYGPWCAECQNHHDATNDFRNSMPILCPWCREPVGHSHSFPFHPDCKADVEEEIRLIDRPSWSYPESNNSGRTEKQK